MSIVLLFLREVTLLLVLLNRVPPWRLRAVSIGR